MSDSNIQEIIEDFRKALPGKVLGYDSEVHALILEPDCESREKLTRILKDMGYGVYQASTIEEARQSLTKISNLALAIGVPRPEGTVEADGVDFLSELKAANQSVIPVLSVTFAESGDAVGALRKNIAGFFIKPYDRREVMRSLSDLLYLHDRHDFLARLIHHFFRRIDENTKS